MVQGMKEPNSSNALEQVKPYEQIQEQEEDFEAKINSEELDPEDLEVNEDWWRDTTHHGTTSEICDIKRS